jgi:hypothetical protein
MRTWYGWIVRIDNSPGFMPSWYVEHDNEAGQRIRLKLPNEVACIEYFDRLAGKAVLLIETPLGAYRVYTESE